METVERRQQIMELLSIHRHMTVSELSVRFCVSERTIRRDIDFLSLYKGIYTSRGRAGGVHMVEGYRNGLAGLTETESGILKKLQNSANRSVCMLSPEELAALNHIIIVYSKATNSYIC